MNDRRPRPHRAPKPVYLIGRKAVLDALAAGVRLTKAFLARADGQVADACRAARVQIELRSPKWLDAQSDGAVHQGALAAFDPDDRLLSPEALLARVANKPKALVLMLDQIHDPRNFGAILRSAAAAGADGVIYRADGQAQLTTAAVKASAGAALSVALVRVANLRYAAEKLKRAGFWHVASVLADDARDYRDVAADKILLTVGNEETGVSPLLAKEADFRVKIPMAPAAESLNVSVAAGVLLFHYLGDRG